MESFEKRHFLGASGCLRNMHILEYSFKIRSFGHFEESINFRQSVVHQIWKTMQFCRYKVPRKRKLHL